LYFDPANLYNPSVFLDFGLQISALRLRPTLQMIVKHLPAGGNPPYFCPSNRQHTRCQIIKKRFIHEFLPNIPPRFRTVFHLIYLPGHRTNQHRRQLPH
jgi:hypothetical protein